MHELQYQFYALSMDNVLQSQNFFSVLLFFNFIHFHRFCFHYIVYCVQLVSFYNWAQCHTRSQQFSWPETFFNNKEKSFLSLSFSILSSITRNTLSFKIVSHSLQSQLKFQLYLVLYSLVIFRQFYYNVWTFRKQVRKKNETIKFRFHD